MLHSKNISQIYVTMELFYTQNTYEIAYPTETVFHKKRQTLGSAGKMMSNSHQNLSEQSAREVY